MKGRERGGDGVGSPTLVYLDYSALPWEMIYNNY